MNRLLVPVAGVVVTIAVAVAVGCSGGGGGGGGAHGSGSGTLTGTIGGSPVTVRSAITAKMSLGNGNYAQGIVLVDASNACVTVSGGKQPASAQLVVFELATVDGSGKLSAPTGPGTFDLFNPLTGPSGNDVAGFLYRQSDATCQEIASASSTSGSVTITMVTGTSWIGSASLVTDGGDDLSATFAAADCPGLGPFLSASSPPPCSM